MRDAASEVDTAPESQRRTVRPEHPSRSTVWAVFLAAVAVALVVPATEAAAVCFTPKRPSHADVPWLEALPAMAAGGLIAVWTFVFWSLIGSFLNVVVHRLPLGQSVVHGGSRCPRCNSPIKWYDNLPVIGWLNLHGHCRSCDLPIAARYPIVESVCAGLCTAVYFRELLSGGANLPGREPDFLYGGPLRLFPNPGLDLIGLYLYHCVAVCTLLVWGLITWDGRRVPVRSILWVLGVAAVLPLAFPLLHPLGLGIHPKAPAGSPWSDRLVQGLSVSVVGGAAGLLCGLGLEGLLGRLLRGDAAGRTGQPLHPPHALGIGLALVGIVWGWQGMLGTVVLLLAACLVQMLVWSAVMEWPTASAELLLAPATLIHLCGWRQLVGSLSPWWPASPTLTCLVLPVTMVIVVSWALVTITPSSGRRPRIDTGSIPEDTHTI